MLTLEQKLLNAGMTKQQIDHHESDLYVLKNEISINVLKNYEFKNNVTTFISAIEPYKNRIWFDVPFAYVKEEK